MSLPLLIQGVGSIGVFSSRAFLPAFVTALLLRFGPQISWLARVGFLSNVRGVPTWFTSDTALIVLGVLSALELVAERVPEARAVLDEVHGHLKTMMAVLTFVGVMSASDRGAVQGVVGEMPASAYLPALAVGAATFFSVRLRDKTVGHLTEHDHDDDLGFQRVLRSVEDLWGLLGPAFLILLPLVTVCVFVLAVILFFLAERAIEARAESAKVSCASCGRPIFATATACAYCKAPRKEPKEVGLLGRTLDRPADPGAHPYRLAAVRRCPVCACRVGRKAFATSCETCGSPVMADPRFADEYVAWVDRRVPAVVAICAVLGLIPVLGVIPAVIYSRLTIVAPFRRYLPPGRNFLVKWGVRLVSIVLVAFQWVPILGGLLLPAMALINYSAYRKAFVRWIQTP